MALADTNVPKGVGKANPRNNPALFKIFQNVQYNVVQHKKYVKEMIKLYKEIGEDVFRESFKNALYYLFTFGDTSPNVDRVIQFVATFSTSLDDEERFLMFIFDIIFDCQSALGQSVRYCASQLLAAVLLALGDDASLDDRLCNKLLASQMQRLQDTRSAVRCRAALALNRLQDPINVNDEVTRAYCFHMSCDPSSSVRRAIVMSIAKCTRNVPFVLERLCDVDEAVRRAAFLYISAMNVTQLRVRQRVLTLKVGLTERSQRVRRVVDEILIPSWLSAFQGNIIDFLKAIRLDNYHDAKDSQYVAGKLLESLFKRLPISELLEWLPTDRTLRLIPAEKLNKETAWYWRHLTEHLQKIDDETLETVLPDLVVLTGYIRAIVESPCPSETSEPVAFSTRQYVLLELTLMLRVYDVSDPAGRQALRTLLTDTLTGDYGPLSADVIRSLVGALQLVEPNASRRVSVACGLVSVLRHPPEAEEAPSPSPSSSPPHPGCTEIKIQRARLRVSLNVAIDAQEAAVKDENYALAAECKAKVADIQRKLEGLTTPTNKPPVQPLTITKEKQCDAATLNKCLIILNSVLDTPQLTCITPMLKLIFRELENEMLQNPEILDNALETVCLYGMLDKQFVKDHKAFFFVHIMNSTSELTVCTILKCIVDLLCVHGAKVFENDDETQNNSKRNTIHSKDAVEADGSISECAFTLSPAHGNVIQLLLKLINSIYPSYRLIVVEGLCRLIYLGHIESPIILSRLILLWFNPATVEEDVLRQTIGIFFQTFSSSVDGAQEQIQKAMIPTLRPLCSAPASSPLSKVDQEAVVRFMVSLTRISHELVDSQGAMARVLCRHLVRRPGRPEAPLLCRALALLAPPRDPRAATALAGMLRDLCVKLPDKQSCRNLTRYLGALEAIERSNLTKMSNTGETDSIQTEDTMNVMGRNATSLPQPLARSTHVVVNETVEEEPEIDETSPAETVSRISEEDQISTQEPPSVPESEKGFVTKEDNGSDGCRASLVKKVKIRKGKKQNVFLREDSDSGKEGRQRKKKKVLKGKENKKEIKEKGVKRTRSQRSIVNVGRAKADTKLQKEPELQESAPLSAPDDLDVFKVTVHRSCGLQSESSTDSMGSKGKKKNEKPSPKPRPRRSCRSSSSQNSAADETELHTIVYEQHMEQELFDDSSELMNSRQITIPETPDASEESETEVVVPTKGKDNGKLC